MRRRAPRASACSPRRSVLPDGSPQRAALRRHREEAGHPRLAHLRHAVRGRRGAAGGRGQSRAERHVRHDERRAPRRRRRGRGAGRAGRWRWPSPCRAAHPGRPSRSTATPTWRGCWRRCAPSRSPAGCWRWRPARRSTAHRCWAMPRRRRGAALLTPIVKAWCTDRGVEVRLARHAGAWRHGLRRGYRRRPGAARRPHRADLRGHQRHPGDGPGGPQAVPRRRRADARPAGRGGGERPAAGAGRRGA